MGGCQMAGVSVVPTHHTPHHPPNRFVEIASNLRVQREVTLPGARVRVEKSRATGTEKGGGAGPAPGPGAWSSSSRVFPADEAKDEEEAVGAAENTGAQPPPRQGATRLVKQNIGTRRGGLGEWAYQAVP